MKLGLQINEFTWPGGPAELAMHLGEIAETAENVGYSSIWVMDHFFQIASLGAPEQEMLEAYTTLGCLAGGAHRVKLGAMVTGVTYRHPGLLVKAVTTLDVLSGGRAYFGVGAAWFDREHRAFGVPFPPVKERFERLEETLQIARQMWGDESAPFDGKHYQLAETLNSPQVVSRPHPPILIGGGGERRTLKLVARYGDACNLFGGRDRALLQHKLDVLKQHCADEGRNYDDIEKTVLYSLNPGEKGENVGAILEQIHAFAEMGFTHTIGGVHDLAALKPFEIIGRHILPQVAAL